MFTYADMSRCIARKLGLPEQQALAVVEALRRSRWTVRWVPGLAGVTTFLGWVFVSGKAASLLEPRFDFLKWLHSSGGPGLLISLLLKYGVALLLAAVTARWLVLGLLNRAVTALPRGEDGRLCVCEDCLYPMNHAPAGEVSRCPECGAGVFKRTSAGVG